MERNVVQPLRFRGHNHIRAAFLRRSSNRVFLAVGKFSDGPYYMLDYCRFLERARKIVISNSIKKTDWQNSQIMSGDLKEIVATLKAEPGKDIILEGGPSLVHDFVRQGLVDDYRMAIWPVILGQGNHYWGSMLGQQTLKLVDVRTLTYGRLFLHYETVRQV